MRLYTVSGCSLVIIHKGIEFQEIKHTNSFNLLNTQSFTREKVIFQTFYIILFRSKKLDIYS